ncbi:hypothetical protein GCM10022399_02580 [Terrabacter ginsenosidimutans]|jgi:hypothetical protein|uniref:Uncharacterized protein n=1 Tax=Terrabacter ginsenosidimutans TaxID=490575 RepID=A0ABP7CKX5_9MICO
MQESNVAVVDQGQEVVITMTRDDYFLVRSLIAETVFLGDPRDFQTRLGATVEKAQELLRGLPDIGA